jgi:hypothetical protein
MNRHALLSSLIAGIVLATSGCCETGYMLHCWPCSAIPVCDSSRCGGGPYGCDAGCAEPCGPACGGGCSTCEPYGDGCAGGCGCSCGCDPCCESCADVCSGGCGAGCQTACGDGYGCPGGPLSWILGILGCGYHGSGCGEFYWSDFHSEPPDCWDPCDCYGNWTGGGCATGGCATGGCTSGYCQVPQGPAGYAAARPSPRVTTGGQSPARGQALAGRPATNRAVNNPSSAYAPRLVSVTERVVSPTPAGPTPPDETAAKPAAPKQAAKPQPVKPSQTTVAR